VEDPASEPLFFRPSAQQFDQSKINAEHDQTHRLEFSSQKFDENIADNRGNGSNLEIGSSENVRESPKQASLWSCAGAFKFAHQQIRVEQEKNKPDLN
jgi:hypothetical protein